jgi:hypothetical protein
MAQRRAAGMLEGWGGEPGSREIRREQIRRRIDAIRARVAELRARGQDDADRAAIRERLTSAQRQVAASRAAARTAIANSLRAFRTVVTTDLDNGGTYTNVFTSNTRDHTIIDNGDGTITITSFASGSSCFYDTHGNFVLKDPGQVRFAVDIDYNGTPGNPDDDVEIPDSFRIVRPSTGNSDLSGRDFCADLVGVHQLGRNQPSARHGSVRWVQMPSQAARFPVVSRRADRASS